MSAQPSLVANRPTWQVLNQFGCSFDLASGKYGTFGHRGGNGTRLANLFTIAAELVRLQKLLDGSNLTRKVVCTMLSWALTFLVIALIAAALGFGGIAGASAGIAKICFFVFLILFVISLIAPRMRSPKL